MEDELFESLLSWLDPNREAAGHKYETIRQGLIRIFVSKGFSDAEDLADVTINRVMTRLPDIRASYVGDPARYFHGVARNVLFEAGRRKEVATDVAPILPAEVNHRSDEYDCLVKCLKFLPSERRDLILDYYLYIGRDKIEHHQRMARALGISPGALRGQAHHIRTKLEACIWQCLGTKAPKQKPVSKS